MKILPFAMFFVLLLLTSCNKRGDLKNYELKEIDATISLPDSYRLVDDGSLDAIVNRDNDEVFKKEFRKLFSKGSNWELLVDKSNPYRFIVISGISPYVPINTNTLYFVIERERSVSSSSPDIVDSTYYVGSKLDSIPGFKFIVSKYKISKSDRKRIGYNYVISSSSKTIGINFYSSEEQETRSFVNSIK